MYKIQDLRDRRERPGTAVEQIQGRDRLKIRKDRIDPRDPEYAGTQDHDDHRCQTLSECPGCRDRAVHERGDPIGKSHDRQALHSRCHDLRIIRK